MNPQLRELYQEVIIEHGRRPRNFKHMHDATVELEGFNPLCGDKLTLFLKIEDDIIVDISFEGIGCAISTASCSLMTEALKGKTSLHAKQFFKLFHQMLTTDTAVDDSLGKLTILAGVREFPARIKCATLAWHTLAGALNGQSTSASTE